MSQFRPIQVRYAHQPVAFGRPSHVTGTWNISVQLKLRLHPNVKYFPCQKLLKQQSDNDGQSAAVPAGHVTRLIGDVTDHVPPIINFNPISFKNGHVT